MSDCDILEDQILECFGRVVYSHKTHEKQADLLLQRSHRIKIWQIVLSAMSSVGFVSIIFGSNKLGAVIGGSMSIILLILNSYTKNYDLAQLAQKHRQTASKLWEVRESYLSLLTDLRMEQVSIEEIVLRRDELQAKLSNIYSGAPNTDFKAYKRAQNALKYEEDLTFAEEEIDCFLPTGLKRSKSK